VHNWIEGSGLSYLLSAKPTLDKKLLAHLFKIRHYRHVKPDWLVSILKLDPAERFRVAQTIWESVEDLPESQELSDEQQTELARRMSEFEINGSEGRPWREVVKAIRSGS